MNRNRRNRPNVGSALTFSVRRWTPDFPGSDGQPRVDVWCDRCGFRADIGVEITDLDEAKHLEATKAHRCMPPTFAWDEWRHLAFEAGMHPDTACAGRALLREHHQHMWGGSLSPDAMLKWGCRAPEEARAAWEAALDKGNDLEKEGIQPRTGATGKLLARDQ